MALPTPDSRSPSEPDDGDIEGNASAAWRGFGDAVTLGVDKPFGAAVGATVGLLGDPRHPGWSDLYAAARARQEAEDQFDKLHYPLARNAGELAGAGLVIAATDGAAAAPSAVRLAPMAPRILGGTVQSAAKALRPWAAAAGAGSGVSVAGQAASDLGSGHMSGPGAYVGAGLGGAAGGVATFARSPAAGSAIDAAINRGIQAGFSGKPIAYDDMAKDAVGGSLMGLLGQNKGAGYAKGLDWREKGDLGEDLARGKSWLLGENITPGRKRAIPVSGGKTIPDHVTDSSTVEAKFGPTARLSDRQKEGALEISNYRIDHFLHDDIGKAVGGLLGLFTAHPHSPDGTQ